MKQKMKIYFARLAGKLNVSTNVIVLTLWIVITARSLIEQDLTATAICAGTFLIAIAITQLRVSLVSTISEVALLHHNREMALYGTPPMSAGAPPAPEPPPPPVIWTGDPKKEADLAIFNKIIEDANEHGGIIEITGREGWWRISYAGQEGELLVVRGSMTSYINPSQKAN